ncbi:MAG: CBS domain-containing protein [Gammaproteobacteria bacterium]|jgi:CBS domain-containing protein|nr:CBS domain-containing protein [Gammaproteobacteria bacterium]
MSIGDICNREVVLVDRDSSVRDAARLMRAHHVGDLVVAEERDGRRVPIGILTDRDIVIEVIAEDVDVGSVAIGDVMSFKLLTAREEDDTFDTIKLMQTKGVRRLPVVDKQGQLVGIVTIDDLIDLLAETLMDVAGLIAYEQKREERIRP